MTFSDGYIWFFATITLIGQIISVILLGILIFSKNKSVKKINKTIVDNYVSLVLIVSTVATVASLGFSLLLNFAPCQFCWYQRILMYPQALIAFVALMTNDLKVKKFFIPLSLIGIALATYHTLMQIFPDALECNDEVAKCSAKEFAEYGYITIPVMSLTAFVMILLISLIAWKAARGK